jgi:2-polyprenyl-3-methyl-5-hydroxy-6-metoxy-1,4-benzoquinol methylase
MPDYSKRSTQIEIMDDLTATGPIIDVTLKELETINLLLGGNYVTINGLAKLLNSVPARKFIIADLGCGSGDILKLIRKDLSKKGIEATLIGIDANPNIVAYARQNTNASDDIQYECIDIFSQEFRERKFDVVIGTLFFHHFTSEQLIGFFSQLRSQVSVGIVINDIHRHWFAYHSIKWLTKMFSKSSMVVHDAPVSVMRAFKRSELVDIMKKAGIKTYTIRWMWAFRWQLIAHFH